MWGIVLAVIVVIVVSLICHLQTGRRAAPSLFLGIAAGLVVLVVTQTTNTISLPTNMEISSRAIIYIAAAAEIALGVYIALTQPKVNQTTIEME